MRTSLSSLFLLCLALPCRGQEYEWHYFRDDPTQAALLRGGRQVGGYSLTEDYFRPFDPATGRWGPRGPSPVPVPRHNFGLMQDKIRDGEHYAINGRASSRQEVQQLLTRGTLAAPKPNDSPSIPDNSDKLRITVIGADAERAPVLADFQKHPALAAWRTRAVVEGFGPQAWQVARAGFVCTGRPTVYVQDAGGKVLHRQDDYDGGAPALAAALIAAERRADPNYRPQKDPDRRKGPLSRLLPRLPWSVPVVAALALVILIFYRRKS